MAEFSTNQDERMIETADDAVATREPAPRPDATTGEPALRAGPFEDKRNAIVEKAKALRRAADGEDPVLGQDIASSRSRVFGSQEGAAESSAPAEAAPRRRLKVNGQEIELGDDEVIAAAQKALAADRILDQAKALRREQQVILEELRAARANQPAAADPRPARQDDGAATMPDGADMAEIIDKIQIGDPEEAQAALRFYGDAIEQRILERIGNLDETIASQVEVVNENRRRREETLATLRSFGDGNPEFRENRALQAALAQQVADTMQARMFEIGVEPETLDELKRRHGMNDAEVTAFAYRALQSQGHAVPSHADILNHSAATLRRQLGMPPSGSAGRTANGYSAEARGERKRALSPQPRRATTPASFDAQERSREDARLQAVQQMRAARRGRG